MSRFLLPLLALLFAGCPGTALVSPGVSLSVDPAEVTLPIGEPVPVTVTLTSTATDLDAWQLSVSPLPMGVTSDAPATVQAGKPLTVNLSADDTAMMTDSMVTLTATKGTSTLTATIHLIVQGDAATGGGTGAGGGAATGGGTATGGGGSSDPCAGYALPNQPSACVCSAGHTCGANHCYGGYVCDTATNRCVPAPAGCVVSTGGGAGTGGGTGTGGGSATGGGAATGGGSATGGGTGTGTLLRFGVTGDTRPPNCNDTANYPTAIISGIASALEAQGAQFVVDEGDHMFVCNYSLATARDQMTLFMNGIKPFTHTWYMAMGNHECTGTCLLNSTNANYVAFMAALAPISAKPYYSFDVDTRFGRATFVIIADNAWDSAQQAWLQSTLTTADTQAKYTLVFRHHPENDTTLPTNPTIMSIIRAHKFAMFIAGHSHLYKHAANVDSGRDLVIGLGGAPLAIGATWNGHAMVEQQADQRLKVTVYDLSGNTVRDTWYASPNQ